MCGLKAPRDEGGEAARFLLKIVENLQVIDAMFDRFANAKHHGGSRAHAELMRGAMHLQPIGSEAFEARNFVAHFIIQNFSSAARDGVKA